MLPMLLVWGLIIWVGVVLVRELFQSSHCNRMNGMAGTTEEILKRRYAKDEINRDEFEQIKKDI